MFALEAGNGPPVVLLHGVTANAFVWLPVLAELATEFHVVALDQRGHGRTTVGDGARYDAAAYAGDVAGVAVSLGEGPVVVVGHSLGARNALVAAARAPALYAGVVAIDFTPFISSDVFDLLDARVAAGARDFADAEELRSYLRDRYPLLPEDAIERRAQHGYGTSPDGKLRPLAARGATLETCRGLREDLSEAVASLSVPTSFVRGAQSALVTEDAFERTRRLRPDLRAVVVEDTDHYVPEERPGAVAEIVASLGRDVARPGPRRPSEGS